MNTWKLHGAVSAILLLSATASQASNKIGPVKILTLNFNDEIVLIDSDNTIRDRRFNAITHWINENSPDVLLFQEGWNYRGDPSFAIPVSKAANYDYAYWIGVGIPGLFLDSNVVMSKKQLQMSGEEDLRLPHSSLSAGDGKTWVLPLGKVTYAVGVRLLLSNGNPLYVYSTHLLGDAPEDRADQLKAIDADAHARAAHDGISWEQAHVVIGGDLNSWPQEPGPAYLEANGYIETFNAVHPGDTNCTDCANPSLPYFNPFTIAYGQFPSQTDETLSQRLDYIFVHSPTLRPISSTMTFTAPDGGVWMSDHYGITTVLDDSDTTVAPGPTHDVSTPLPDTIMVPISTEQFLCKNINPIYPGCNFVLPALNVQGPRGVTFKNDSEYLVNIAVRGPGHIFTSPNASLPAGDATTYVFDTPGEYTYTVNNLLKPNELYGGTLSGSFHVGHVEKVDF